MKEKKDQNLLKYLMNVFSFILFFNVETCVKKEKAIINKTTCLFLLYFTFSVTDVILSCFISNNYQVGMFIITHLWAVQLTVCYLILEDL